MRSNIARTCASGRVPRGDSVMSLRLVGAQRRHEVDELVELLRVLALERRVGGHRRGRVRQSASDRVLAEPVADLGQIGTERVAVLTDLVAGETARGGRRSLALLEPR